MVVLGHNKTKVWSVQLTMWQMHNENQNATNAMWEIQCDKYNVTNTMWQMQFEECIWKHVIWQIQLDKWNSLHCDNCNVTNT